MGILRNISILCCCSLLIIASSFAAPQKAASVKEVKEQAKTKTVTIVFESSLRGCLTPHIAHEALEGGGGAIVDLTQPNPNLSDLSAETHYFLEDGLPQAVKDTCQTNCQFPAPGTTAADCNADCSHGPCLTCCNKIGGGAACQGGCPP